MKKFFTLAVIAVASVFGASAGDGYIGGSIGFMHNEENDSPATNQFTILPEIGYNFNKTWAVGTTIGYTYTHFNGYDANLHLFEFNPYARWSFFRSSNNLVQLFVDGGAGIGLGSFDVDGDDSHTAVTWNIGLRPGVAFNVTKNFSVVAHVGFLGYKGANNAAFDGGEPRQGGVFLNGNDLTLGFYYNF
ncbi:MAG: porin family protein [Muribaculaceae bacterium]|nr:porin family protein [Muribaculaceae bacterium]